MLTKSRLLSSILMSHLLLGCQGDLPDTTGEGWTDAGLYELIVTPQPDPPVAGDTVLAMEVLDVDGAAVTEATVTVTPWMPDMDHGIMGDVTISEPTPGQYEAAFAYSMPGYWELTIVVDGGPGVDQRMVAYDVQ